MEARKGSMFYVFMKCFRTVSGLVRRYGAGTAQGWYNVAQFPLGDAFPRYIPIVSIRVMIYKKIKINSANSI